jgi:ribose/xylose/arabinose/galactoside ABC-type transport system permease subunit
MSRLQTSHAAASKPLDGGGASRDGRSAATRGTTMEAIYAILIFVVAIFVLNRLEFGRVD